MSSEDACGGGNALCGGISSPVANLEPGRSPATCLALSANLPTDRQGGRQTKGQTSSVESGRRLVLLGCYGPAGLEELGQGPPAVVPFSPASCKNKAKEENLLCVGGKSDDDGFSLWRIFMDTSALFDLNNYLLREGLMDGE